MRCFLIKSPLLVTGNRFLHWSVLSSSFQKFLLFPGCPHIHPVFGAKHCCLPALPVRKRKRFPPWTRHFCAQGYLQKGQMAASSLCRWLGFKYNAFVNKAIATFFTHVLWLSYRLVSMLRSVAAIHFLLLSSMPGQRPLSAKAGLHLSMR